MFCCKGRDERGRAWGKGRAGHNTVVERTERRRMRGMRVRGG